MIAQLPYEERVKIGKADENKQVEVLRKNGYQIEDATKEEDTIDKIDRFLVVTENCRESIQIKGRDENARYTDILVDQYEPYCGLDHPLTKTGRDQVSKYKWFTCRIKHDMYLVSGAAQKKVIEDVMEEWRVSPEREEVDRRIAVWVAERSGSDWPEDKDFFRSLPVMRSKKYRAGGKSIEVRCTQDWKNRRPKLLVFIPPTVYTGKQAKKFEMD